MTQEKGRGHFPGVRVKPLCHLSTVRICRTRTLQGQAESGCTYPVLLSETIHNERPNCGTRPSISFLDKSAHLFMVADETKEKAALFIQK
jgi:hypothetical protein